MENDTNLFPLIERIGNLVRTEIRKEGSDLGLQPVHLQALDYLAKCNRYSDTSAAVTEYLGATKGTVSQSLKVLEKKAYITKVTDVDDKRVQHLKVSRSGYEVLKASVPPKTFEEANRQINDAERRQLVVLLTRLLKEMQRVNYSNSFGVCKSCRYFLSNGNQFQCGLTQETLSQSDSEKICREHTQPAESIGVT
ncbi:MAG: MarR family winged helix-turn-helix transcriptional regulator [Gammaproteobacteria bacterium]